MTNEEKLNEAQITNEQAKAIEQEIRALCFRLRYLRAQKKAYIKKIQSLLNYNLWEDKKPS